MIFALDLRFSVLAPAILKVLGVEVVQLILNIVGTVILLFVSAGWSIYQLVSKKRKAADVA